MCNVEIRVTAKRCGVYLYELADKLSISEPTMTRLLRKELSESKKQQLLGKIEEISREKRKAAYNRRFWAKQARDSSKNNAE